MSAPRIHPTAIVEEGVVIGEDTQIWDHVHIRRGARLGKSCIVGEKTYIAYDVEIGSYVKINAHVYICAMVKVEDFVMISAGTVFTNDRLPRAFLQHPDALALSEPTEQTLATLVRRGATIGANATIGCGLEVGSFAMVGMGSVVTKSVPDFGLVYGSPASLRGFVCVCGEVLVKESILPEGTHSTCRRCERNYVGSGRSIHNV